MYIEKYLDSAQFTCFRVGWIYGHKTKRSFIHKFLKNIVDTQKRVGKNDCDITVVSDQISTPTSVKFICDAVIHSISIGFMSGVVSLCPKGSVTKYNYALKILTLVKQLYNINIFEHVNIIKTETHQTDIAYPLDSRLEKFSNRHIPTDITWQKDLKEYMTIYSSEFKTFIEDILNV
jgi:dTDP-4-dehydrorhamnose reductase